MQKLIPFLALLALTGACKQKIPNDNGIQQKQSSQASIFAPGIISTGLNERDAALSPDGNEFYYTIQYKRTLSMILSSKKENGKWSTPQVVDFSGHYKDLEPVFHPDGKRLFFVSNRPLNKGGKAKDYDIWYVERTENGWSEPINPGAPLNSEANEFYPSFTNDGTIYFCAKKENTFGGEDLYFSKEVNGKYLSPENMGDSINSESNEYNSFIAPDGSFIMYNTYDDGDMYIAFKNENGQWQKPVNMGKKVNSEYFEFCPGLSPDGNYLFFTSKRMDTSLTKKPANYATLKEFFDEHGNGEGDIYKISTDFLNELKQKK